MKSKVWVDIEGLMKSLQQKIEYHNYLYYILDNPKISDRQYDGMFRELQELEAKHPEFKDPNSPTTKVGGKPLDSFKPYKHNYPMLSLANAMNEKELTKWVEGLPKDVQLVAEPKIDGLSVEIEYVNGIYKSAGTRGDGNVGEDVTEQVRTIKNLPLRLREGFPSYLRVRGEVYIEKSRLVEINKEREKNGEKPFANCRNAAAGSLRNLDPSITASRGLKIAIYGMENTSLEDIDFEDEAEMLIQFEDWGLPIVDYWVMKNVINTFNQYKQRRENFPMDIDGTVFKANSFDLRKQLGETSHSPRWAIAAKFDADTSETKLKYVFFQVGRTGVITPVADLYPVRVGGAEISKATLHNEDQIKLLGLKVPSIVKVRRAGDVIPEIVEMVSFSETSRDVEFPKECPCCGSKLVKVNFEVAWRCTNKNCTDQIIAKVIHWASRDCLDIKGLGEETVRLLVHNNLVLNPFDLYDLTEEDLLELPGFATKSARKLIQSISASRRCGLDRFINALGILGIGKKVSKDLAKRFVTTENFFNPNKNHYLALLEIDGIGETLANNIRDFIEEEIDTVLGNIEDLEFQIIPSENLPYVNPNDTFWVGKNVVITGAFSKKREEISKLIEAKGGSINSSVSKNTDIVLAGEKPGSKLEKAQSLGLLVLDENCDEIQRLLKGE